MLPILILLSFFTFVLRLLSVTWPGSHFFFKFFSPSPEQSLLHFLSTQQSFFFQQLQFKILTMFAKFFTLIAASAMILGVICTPVARHSSSSFDNWRGISSLNGFDNFYGSDNFSGSSFSTTVIEQQQELVCHSESIEIIQQRLLVLQEYAKRIITEQICEVETQTVVFQQFTASISSFSSDLSRQSGRSVGYDSGIASHFGNLQSSDGSLTNNDLGFSGHDLGNNYVNVQGSNWNSQTSPFTVGAAQSAAQRAASS